MKEVTDRVVQYPRRFKLTKVVGTEDEYELTPVPGTVQEAGTPINKELFDSIKTDIENEKTAREAKDTEHDKAITSNAKLISAEAQTRAQADEALSRAISTEAETRDQAIEAVDTKADNHILDKNNPHIVTKSQIGLSAVDNVRQYSAENEPPYPVTSVDGKNGAVTTEAVKYTAQTLKDEQKQQAQRNILLRSSATLTSAGWYKICNSPNGVHLRINLANVYTGANPSVIQIDVYKGHTDNNSKLEVKAEGCALGYFTKLRIFNNNDIEVYCSASTSSTMAICMIEFTARDSNDVTIYNFEPSTNTGSALKEIDIKNGINTTGKIYENGGRVLSVNSSDLSDEEAGAIKNNIGINTSVMNTQRVYANYALSGNSTSWKKIASFNVGDFNIHVKIYGGLSNTKLVREINFSGVNGNIDSADSWEFYSTDLQIYYVYRDKAGNYAWIDVYAQFGGYWKYYIEVEATGCGLAEKGNTSEISSLPSGSIKIPVKRIISIDPTKLNPWADDSDWSFGTNPKLTQAGLYLIAADYTSGSSQPTKYYPNWLSFDGEIGATTISTGYNSINVFASQNGIIFFDDVNLSIPNISTVYYIKVS